MFEKRIISSIVLIGIVAAAIFFDWLFYLLVIIMTLLGLKEFFGMLELKGINVYKYFGIFIGVMIPLSILFRFELTKKWELLFLVLALLFLITMQLKRRQHSGVIVGISTTIFGILYVSWLFSFVIKIRSLPNGIGFIAGLLLITKLGDIGAYCIGSRFGRTPLIPRISPNKSVEGAIGGLCSSITGALLCRFFLPFNCLQLVILGVFLGVLGQLGDLSESLMKRDCQIKDSADTIPGMGGVLDLMDSVLFTAPVFYFYISIVLKYMDF